MERRMRATGEQSRESRVESRKGAGRLVSTFDFRLSIFVLIGLALSSTGCSAGAYAVMFTGLRHPDVFRALAVRQGNFRECYVEPCIPFLDPHQPVMLMYGNLDTLKDEAEEAITWLQAHDMQPTRLERL